MRKERARMTVFGCARVSADGQTLNAQVAELKTAGAKQVYREKFSGSISDRKHLRTVLSGLREGDVLLLTRLARWSS